MKEALKTQDKVTKEKTIIKDFRNWKINARVVTVSTDWRTRSLSSGYRLSRKGCSTIGSKKQLHPKVHLLVKFLLLLHTGRKLKGSLPAR